METIKTIEVTIKGDSPLLMHNDTLCDPIHPLTKELGEYTKVKKKTEKHHEAIAKVEFEAGLYYDEDLGLHIPSRLIFGCLKAAAKKTRQGVSMKAFSINEIGYSLIGYKKQTPLSLWNSLNENDGHKYVHRQSVTVGRSKIMRTRPIFQNWGFKFDGELDLELIQVDEFLRMLTYASHYCGLGDLRPEKSTGSFGKFEVESFKVNGEEYGERY